MFLVFEKKFLAINDEPFSEAKEALADYHARIGKNSQTAVAALELFLITQRYSFGKIINDAKGDFELTMAKVKLDSLQSAFSPKQRIDFASQKVFSSAPRPRSHSQFTFSVKAEDQSEDEALHHREQGTDTKMHKTAHEYYPSKSKSYMKKRRSNSQAESNQGSVLDDLVVGTTGSRRPQMLTALSNLAKNMNRSKLYSLNIPKELSMRDDLSNLKKKLNSVISKRMPFPITTESGSRLPHRSGLNKALKSQTKLKQLYSLCNR